MTDSQLKVLTNAIEALADNESEIRFDLETHNMLFGCLTDIAEQLKRIADTMEAGQ